MGLCFVVMQIIETRSCGTSSTMDFNPNMFIDIQAIYF